ncbi:hypothetical protein XPA_009292 [Xanthoria parietina]
MSLRSKYLAPLNISRMYAFPILLSIAASALQVNAAPGIASPSALQARAPPGRAPPIAVAPTDDQYGGIFERSSNVYMSDGGQCYQYSACGLIGVALWNELERTLDAGAANDVNFDHERIFNKYYLAGVSRGPSTAADYLQDDMRQHDLSELKDYWRWTVWSLTPDGTADDAPCYEFSINPKDGVIIAHYSDATKDSHKRLPLSEIFWQTYQTHIGMISSGDSGQINPLQYVIIHKIDNEGTIKLLDEIAQENGEDPKEEIEWYTWDDSKPFFISLLGTDPLQQVVRMTIDHNAAMVRRTIGQVWTHGLSTTGKRDRDIWVKFDAFVPKAAAGT